MEGFYNKKGVIGGLIVSLILLGISYVLGTIFWITPLGMYAIFIIHFTLPVIFYPFLPFFVLTPIFILINSLILFLTREYKSFKRGIKWGYSFLLIFLAIIIFQYIQIGIGFQKYDASKKAEKLIESGDVSICDKMVVKEGYENQVPSTKDIKENCYKKVTNWAVETGNASNCDRLLSNLPSFNSCVLQIAQKNKDADICRKLETDVLMKSCYLLIK